MKRLLLTVCVFCVMVTVAEARRSLMSGVMQRPSQYTQNKMRVERARTEYKLQRYRTMTERSRIRANELRRQDYMRNKAHNDLILREQRIRSRQ